MNLGSDLDPDFQLGEPDENQIICLVNFDILQDKFKRWQSRVKTKEPVKWPFYPQDCVARMAKNTDNFCTWMTLGK